MTSGAKQPGDKYYETGTQAEYVEPGLELKYVHVEKILMTTALFREENQSITVSVYHCNTTVSRLLAISIPPSFSQRIHSVTTSTLVSEANKKQTS